MTFASKSALAEFIAGPHYEVAYHNTVRMVTDGMAAASEIAQQVDRAVFLMHAALTEVTGDYGCMAELEEADMSVNLYMHSVENEDRHLLCTVYASSSSFYEVTVATSDGVDKQVSVPELCSHLCTLLALPYVGNILRNAKRRTADGR